ncbi:sensor histidine kinase [Propionivibrio sp.]|uniref:sensor histidine kinase n=1 Tax=Propionivibrio sp. TaxID=2212460 RepID=UPI003BF313D4
MPVSLPFSRARLIVLNLAVAMVYSAAGAFGLWLGGMVEGNVTLLWPPTGIALAAAYLFGARIWPGLCVGAFVATASTGAPLGFALATAVGNPLPAMAALLIVRRWRGGQPADLRDLTDTVLLICVGALLTPTLSAGVGVAGLWLNGMIPAAAMPAVFVSWYVGDAVGAAMLAPMLIVLWQHNQGGALRTRPLEALALALTTLAFSLLLVANSITHSEFLVIASFPLIIWAALRFDALTTVTLALLIDAFAIAALIGWLRVPGATAQSLRILEIQLFTMAISATGLILAMAVAERDVSWRAQKVANDQLQREASKSALAGEALTLANRDLQRFAEVTAHHLQEPARRLASYADRLSTHLAGRLDDPEAQLSLTVIDQQARYMKNLLRDIERYLAADQPRGKVDLVDARQTVARILERAKDQISTADAEIAVGNLPAAWIDAPRLADLFKVVLDNALIHGCLAKRRPGENEEKTPTLRISIDGERQDSRVRYRVSDNGPGIEAQYRERVFRIFERLSSSGGTESTGIGLAIMRRIAESCGGRTWIEETPGGGCSVVFELPSEEIP